MVYYGTQDVLKSMNGRLYVMFKKRKAKKAVLKGMAFAAKKTAQFNADNFCAWWHYQPKMPNAVKKMHKS